MSTQMKLPRLVPLALVLVIDSGCRTWRVVPRPSELAGPLAAQSRVIRTNGERTDIAQGWVTPDSVIGISRAGRVSVPRDSVARVEERRVNVARSIVLVLPAYLGLVYLFSDSPR
jgi:hypothetical protein